MSDEKLFEDDNFDDQFDLAELDELYESGEDVGSFEDLEYVAEDEELSIVEQSERRWLTIGLASLFIAVLFRILLTPLLDIQEQRADQADDLLKLVASSNASSIQALTLIGDYELFRQNIGDLTDGISAQVSEQTLTESTASTLFSNNSLNAELIGIWDLYSANANSFIAKQVAVTNLKNQLVKVSLDIRDTSTTSVSFVEAVSTEGRSKQSGREKDEYLFLTSEAADINGILSRLSTSILQFFVPNADLQSLSDSQNTLMVRLNDTLGRITNNATAVVSTAAEPLQTQFDIIESGLLETSDNSVSLTDSRAEVRQMRIQADELTSAINASVNNSSVVTIVNLLNIVVPLFLFAFGIFALWRFTNLQSSDLIQSEGTLSDALADQQESILKLLDEMSALADGDLTVEAEVTDQITGAIADSVNFAVIEMRELVSQITRASVQVKNESELAVTNAQSVSQSNMMQAKHITSAATDMQKVTDSMRLMSEQAHSSSEMANDSLKTATQGSQAVRDTIKEMDDMREQIQDTSKRIKRLGESSQRIGDIVALIDDIAEQTNILSLNAAIQASMAGEAGRGFAVVSDEVQSLAERSTEATKKIAELVTTIQNDTNDAVSSMEKATQQVIAGTKVADKAGGALAEIELASKSLSELVANISESANSQALVVVDVAKKVSIVSDSSTETSKKAQTSANSIAKLLELSNELETSVSRFKLPAS